MAVSFSYTKDKTRQGYKKLPCIKPQMKRLKTEKDIQYLVMKEQQKDGVSQEDNYRDLLQGTNAWSTVLT